MKNLSNQKKGSLLAFIAVMLITPDSILIRLSNIETWGMLFYRGAIPFIVVLVGLILFYTSYRFIGKKNGSEFDMLGLRIKRSEFLRTFLLAVMVFAIYYIILFAIYFLFHVLLYI